MQFYTGCLTGEIIPNWPILSCHFCLLCWPLSAQSSEVPLDDILPCCSWTTRSTLPMGWCPLVKSLVDPVFVQTLKMSKPLQSAFFDEHWLFSQGTRIFICEILWARNSKNLSLASHINRVQSGPHLFQSDSSPQQHTRALRGRKSWKASWFLGWEGALSKPCPTLLLCQFYNLAL